MAHSEEIKLTGNLSTMYLKQWRGSESESGRERESKVELKAIF